MLPTTEAISIFDSENPDALIAGFRLNKLNQGNFIFIAGRPYRFENTSSYTNYNYIIDNWMNSNLVPVELVSFTAEVLESAVMLKWSTASEINNKGFIVQMREENKWNDIEFIQGFGTTTERKFYYYLHKINAVQNNSLEYRLKQIDYDGTVSYSDIVKAEIAAAPISYELYQNYPNPFNPETKIIYAIPQPGLVTLKVYDMLGREIKTLVNEIKQRGIFSVDFRTDGISSGTYFYKIQSGEFSDTKKMTILK
jgi:hypothetical protein